MSLSRRVAATSFALCFAAGLAACGGDEPSSTLTRDDVPGATADPETTDSIPNQAPCDELDQVEDDLVVANDYTKQGGEAVTIKAKGRVTVDSSIWPSRDPDKVISDMAAAVVNCASDDAGATYEEMSGPEGAIGYTADLATTEHKTRIQRLFVASGKNVVIVGVRQQYDGAPSPLEAADLVKPALAAAKSD